MKKIHLLSLLLLSFFMVSCFDIVEEVNVNNDGSGDMLVTLDMSKSKDQLSNYMEAGEINGVGIPDAKQLDGYFSKFKKMLEGMNGISNVNIEKDLTNFIIKVRGDFTNVAAMNKAVNKLTKELSRGMLSVKNNYQFVNGRFIREFEQELLPTDYDKLPVMQRFMLETANLTSIYRFKRTVKNISNKDATISPSKKAVKFESSLGDIAKGVKTIENTISL